jgi:hypothetical protein
VYWKSFCIGVNDEKICEKWSTTEIFYQDIRSIWIDKIKILKEYRRWSSSDNNNS